MKCFEQLSKRLTVIQIPSKKYGTSYYIYEEVEGLIKYNKDEIIEMRNNNQKMRFIDFKGNKLRDLN